VIPGTATARLRRTAILVIAFWCLVTAAGYGESKRVLINTGHSGELTAMEYQDRYGLLFTAGTEGSVRAWDPATRGLVYLLQVSHLPIRALAVNPEAPEVAVIESDGLSVFRLSVWNWQNQSPVFSVDLPELPLFLQYSPKGSFLLYGTATWNGLVLLDSRTGEPLPVLGSAPGIVSSAFMSATENTVLTYSPSGYLKYWDMRNGTLKAEIPTLSGLRDCSFTGNGRYMAALLDGDLVIVDLISGKPAVYREPSEKWSLASLRADTLLTLSAGQPRRIVLWNVQNGVPSRQRIIETTRATASLPGFALDGAPLPRKSGTASITECISVNSIVYTGYATGEIMTQAPDDPVPLVFSRDNLLPIFEMTVGRGSLVLTSSESVVICTSDFFEGNAIPSYFSADSQPNPEEGPLSLRGVGDNLFLAWTASDDSGPLYLFSPDDNLYSQVGNHARPIMDIECTQDQYLILDSAGAIELRRFGEDAPAYAFTYPGLRDICLAESFIMAAGNSAFLLSSPLLWIDPSTGETVPIPDSNVLTFKLRYDARRSELYSLGFEKRSGSIVTVLKAARGPDFERNTTRLSYPGEDIGADLVIDPETGTLFTSLGYRGVRALSWSGFSSLAPSDHIPRQLAQSGPWLFGLNTDKSITVWDTRSGERIMDLFIFDDLEWVALFADGEYYCSPNGEKYVSVFDEESLRSGETGGFRRNQ